MQLKENLSKLLLRSIYFIVYFFIIIGEVPRRVLILFFLLIKKLIAVIVSVFLFLKKSFQTLWHGIVVNVREVRFYIKKHIFQRILQLYRVVRPVKRGRPTTHKEFFGKKIIRNISRSSVRFFSSAKKWSFSQSKVVVSRYNATPLKKVRKTFHWKVQWPKLYLTRVRFKRKPSSVNLTTTRSISPIITLASKLRYFLLGCFLTLFTVFIYQSYVFVQELPSPRNIGKVNYALSTHIYDRNGQLLYEIYRDQNRTPVELSSLPKYVAEASISIEDKDFYHHNGISLYSGVLRALKDMYKTKSLQGGSTITQQLVKSSLLTPERTIERKIKEAVLALWTEQMYTKNQILEMYLNQVPYGGSAYGIQEAAKTFFAKNAKDLTVSEAAFLAGLPQAPSVYSPYISPDLAVNRRNEVLQKMYEQKYITKQQRDQALKEQLIVQAPKTNIKAPHFVFYIKQQLEAQYGIRMVEEGGLDVYTTLDLKVQEEAEKILKEEVDKVKNLNVGNGAILVTKPGTGEILAMVGSVDYHRQPDGAFNVTTAMRQPGSSIKPIMYSLALEKGFTAASVIQDVPTTFIISDTEKYSPVNYDGKFHGPVTLRTALANSFNIPAVKVLQAVGVKDFISHAIKMGITNWHENDPFGLSLTLGGGEVPMTNMATAYGVLANGGDRVNLSGIMKITNSRGDDIFHLQKENEHVLDRGIAYILSDILSDNNARSLEFGPHSALEMPGYQVAVKTGTTDNKLDNWTIGYTPEYLVATWVGNNDNSPMNPYLASGITGAAPIWHRVMQYLLDNNKGNNTWYTMPDDVIARNCFQGKKEYFLIGTEQTSGCQDMKSVADKNPLPPNPNPTNNFYNKQ